MRCAKCNYISFDYNQICPKCNKDLKDIQVQLNLPDFQPSPPSFLGMMVGDGNDSSVNLEIGLPPHLDEIGPGDDVGLEVSEDMLTEEPATETGEPELDLSFDTEEPEVVGDIEEEDVISDVKESEIEDIGAVEKVAELVSDGETRLEEEISSDIDEIDLDFEDLTSEEKIDDREIPEEIAEEKDADQFLLEVDELTIDELESDDRGEKEEQPYNESELVTMEIDRKKFNLPDDKGKKD